MTRLLHTLKSIWARLRLLFCNTLTMIPKRSTGKTSFKKSPRRRLKGRLPALQKKTPNPKRSSITTLTPQAPIHKHRKMGANVLACLVQRQWKGIRSHAAIVDSAKTTHSRDTSGSRCVFNLDTSYDHHATSRFYNA
jgi:hypothetical protein